jgi:hypothetical protein
MYINSTKGGIGMITSSSLNTWVSDEDPILYIATDQEIKEANEEFFRTFNLPTFDKICRILDIH